MLMDRALCKTEDSTKTTKITQIKPIGAQMSKILKTKSTHNSWSLRVNNFKEKRSCKTQASLVFLRGNSSCKTRIIHDFRVDSNINSHSTTYKRQHQLYSRLLRTLQMTHKMNSRTYNNSSCTNRNQLMRSTQRWITCTMI